MGVRSCLLPFLIQMLFNSMGTFPIYCYCNEILMRLHKIFRTGKKQDLTPFDPLFLTFFKKT